MLLQTAQGVKRKKKQRGAGGEWLCGMGKGIQESQISMARESPASSTGSQRAKGWDRQGTAAWKGDGKKETQMENRQQGRKAI